jgi:hypothetical protein
MPRGPPKLLCFHVPTCTHNSISTYWRHARSTNRLHGDPRSNNSSIFLKHTWPMTTCAHTVAAPTGGMVMRSHDAVAHATAAIYFWNIRWPTQQHHAISTCAPPEIYFWNIQIKRLQHTFKTDETLAWNMRLKHACIAITIYANPDLLLQYSNETLVI